MSGWISIHRKIQEHWLWQEKPFDKKSAWIDLLLMANYQDNKFLLGNELVEIKRGSFITSELKLMNKWGWSKSKVRNFLSLLEGDGMLIKKADTKKTTITIVNYDSWQERETTERPQKNHEETTKGLRKDTNNKENKENKENNYICIVDYLNKKANKGFKANAKATQRFIDARINEGFSIDDFKQVIDIKSNQWLGGDMEQYLRPQTLFGTKFESYLNERGGGNGTNRTNSEGTTTEVNRLKELAIKEGLIGEDGSVEDIGEIDY